MKKVGESNLPDISLLRRIVLNVKKVKSMVGIFLYHYKKAIKSGINLRTYVFDKEKEVVYLNNPKVACSSIKKSMFGEQPCIHWLPDNTIEEDLSPEMKRFYKFTFVRNPFKRLVSCFEDKCIQHPDDPCWDGFYYNLYRVQDFGRFIRRVYLIPDSMSESHVTGQYRLIYDKKGNCLVDFVGKVENIKEEYEPIRQRFGFLPLPHSNRAASLTGKNWMDYYTPFTAWLVYRKYKKDFITFGYEDEYRKLKAYVKNK